MRNVFFLILILFFASFSNNCTKKSEKKLFISNIAGTSFTGGLPQRVFEGKEWKTQGEFAKIYMYLDEATNIGSFEVETCSVQVDETIAGFINFDEYSEEKMFVNKKVTFEIPSKVQDTRSVTLNFQENQDFCLKSIRFFDREKKNYDVVTVENVDGYVTASSTHKPYSAYGVMNMFDSRYEHAWATEGKTKDLTLLFEFKKKKKVTKIRIWNGYQRSDVHYFSNARTKNIIIEGPNGEKENLMVLDRMGAFIIDLKKPFKGKSFKIHVKESYPGRVYKDLVISEMKFFDGERWFQPNPLPHLRKLSQDNIAKFRKAKLGFLLGKEISGSEKIEKKGISKNSSWEFRFRTDGSMFLRGDASGFFGLGNFNVTYVKPGEMTLAVFGFLRRITEFEDLAMDCNGCGRDCNLTQRKIGKNEKIFQDFFLIKRTGENTAKVINIGKRKNLNFKEIEAVISK